MENILFILIGIGIAAFIGYQIYKKKANRVKIEPGTPTTELSPDLQKKLPGMWTDFKESLGGVKVYSVVPIPDSALTALQSAAELSIKVQQRLFPEWKKGLTLPEYEIWLLEPDGIAPNAQIPFLYVGGVMSAGTIGQGTRPVVILPHYAGIGWTRLNDLSESAFNEMEHWREYLNDRNVFLQFTGAGDSHPHFPIPEDLKPRGLMAARKQANLPCGFNKS